VLVWILKVLFLSHHLCHGDDRSILAGDFLIVWLQHRRRRVAVAG
jgi:hypothetical protein